MRMTAIMRERCRWYNVCLLMPFPYVAERVEAPKRIGSPYAVTPTVLQRLSLLTSLC